MKRTSFVVAVLVTLVAAGASASSLSVVSDKTTYNVGETITLTVSGNDNDVPGSYLSAFGALTYSAALTNDGGPGSQNLIGTGWIAGTLPAIDGSRTMFDQLNFNGGVADNLPGGNPFATATLIAEAAGVVSVTWRESDLVWFDLVPSSAVGTTFTILAVPEPTTAAMLGLGLLGLALGGRRRS